MKPTPEEVREAAATLREFALLDLGPDLRRAIDVAASYIEGQKEAESPWRDTAPKDGTEVPTP